MSRIVTATLSGGLIMERYFNITDPDPIYELHLNHYGDYCSVARLIKIDEWVLFFDEPAGFRTSELGELNEFIVFMKNLPCNFRAELAEWQAENLAKWEAQQ